MSRHPRVVPVLLSLSLGIAFGEADRTARWQQDIQEMVRFVTTTHPDLYAQVSRDRFQQETSQLLESVAQKTDAEVVIAMQRLLALAGDGHTALGLLQPGSPLRRLPLRLYWFSDGMYVTDAGSAYLRTLGRKLVRIENVAVEEAVQRVAPFISTENQWHVRSQAPALLTSPEVLAASSIAASAADPVRFTFEESDGSTFTVPVTAAAVALLSLPQKARPNPPLYRRYAERFYWFDYLEPGTIYIKYNVAQESPVLTMAQFLEAAAQFVAAKPVTATVIDLRNNGGGNSEVIRPLLANLAYAIATGQISADRISVIIGRDTFSSGMLAAIDLKHMGARLVGEPTGNRPNHFGNVVNFTLPNSGLTGSCSTKRFQFPDLPEDALNPDVSVPLSSSDFFDEKDPVLDRIPR